MFFNKITFKNFYQESIKNNTICMSKFRKTSYTGIPAHLRLSAYKVLLNVNNCNMDEEYELDRKRVYEYKKTLSGDKRGYSSNREYEDKSNDNSKGCNNSKGCSSNKDNSDKDNSKNNNDYNDYSNNKTNNNKTDKKPSSYNNKNYYDKFPAATGLYCKYIIPESTYHQICIDVLRIPLKYRIINNVDYSYIYVNVLVLIAYRRPYLGYVQGMSDILIPFVLISINGTGKFNYLVNIRILCYNLRSLCSKI